MSHFKYFNKTAFVACLSFILVMSLFTPIWACPMLQLDIKGGSYDSATQTIIAPANVFDLYALLIPSSSGKLSDYYYISAAIVPKVNKAADLGSFIFNGSTIDVTDDMNYGVPPLETNLSFDSGDLGKHGIFETFFTEFKFKFNPANRANIYDSQLKTGTGPTPNNNGSLYFAKFTIDTTLLAAGYDIHFDLYNEAVRCGDTDVNKFAPFSHDAESHSIPVPEPSAFLLVGSGLLGLASYARHRKPA